MVVKNCYNYGKFKICSNQIGQKATTKKHQGDTD